jgi:hypothetical protein
MADLVALDDGEDLDHAQIIRGPELVDDQRRGIEPARFQHARHQRHAHQRVVRGFQRHVPQPVVRGEVAVGMAQRRQMPVQQIEMQRLLVRHPQPVGVIRRRHAGKAVGGVERQVDRVEFDMRQRMNQRGAPGQGVGAAARHLLRRDHFGFLRLAGLVDRLARRFAGRIDRAGQPVGLQRVHAGHLGRRFAGLQTLGQPLRQQAQRRSTHRMPASAMPGKSAAAGSPPAAAGQSFSSPGG